MLNEFYLDKPYAKIKELSNVTNKDEIRIYCSQREPISKNHTFTFQIRTHKPTNEYGTGKKRNMMASVHLTIEEMESILNFMKSE